ncbi:MAG: hypothetical protein Q8R08_04745 [bacterium]|nr:hypothetical protein [bacterium]
MKTQKRFGLTSDLVIVSILTILVMAGWLTASNSQVSLNTSGAATPSSIVLNQDSPGYGDSINFTGVYPKEATVKVGQRQANNPVTSVDCYQNGVWVYNQLVGFATSKPNGDGTITGTTGFMTLGGVKNEKSWLSGAATCVANLYYFDRAPKGSVELIYRHLASLNFLVAD